MGTETVIGRPIDWKPIYSLAGEIDGNNALKIIEVGLTSGHHRTGDIGLNCPVAEYLQCGTG